MRNHKLAVRLSVILIAIALLVTILPASSLVPATVSVKADNGASVADKYLGLARDYFNSRLKKLTDVSQDPNEVIRVLVEFEEEAVAESLDTLAYTEEAQEAEDSALAEQAALIAKIERLTGNEAINRTAYLFNGISIEMKRSQMREVAAMDGVKSVNPVTTLKQDMATAVDMTTATELWKQENGGYTGEGIVIAIIDSGINYNHPDMQLREGAKVKFTKEQMEQKIADLGYGRYFTDKVPFGFSYGGKMDGDIYNSAVNHGLHVSGIAAANGETIKGVAPDAQLFGMQVFTSSGSAYTDDIIRAVEDSVKLGADVLNLSLGGGAGFYDDIDYLQEALAYAEEQGVVCCVAAGNDGVSSSATGAETNDWGLSDTGAVSGPSTDPSALSVASVDNAYAMAQVVTIKAGETVVAEDYAAFDISQGNKTNWSSLGGLQLVDCKYGQTDDFTEIPEGDWVALIQRGSADGSAVTFDEKVTNARNKGAKAVILYNNVETDEVINAGAENNSDFYAMMVSGNLGKKLKEYVGQTLTFTDFTSKQVKTGSPMSYFTSWGPTPTLDIKPEITAPGGNITSVSFDSGYAAMSGTSMATPYMAGSSAIVLQALRAAVESGDLKLPEGMKLNDYLKLTMMNTADPMTDPNGAIYSVRQQGAGLVNQKDAADNRVLATYKTDGLAAVALREISGTKTSFTVTLTNYGTESQSYRLPTHVPVYMDYTNPQTTGYGDVLYEDALITFDTTSVTVEPGASVDVVCTLTLPDEQAENPGHFVEGYIRFESDGDGVEITVPVMGFYGDWDTVNRVIDSTAFDEDNTLYNYYIQGFDPTSSTFQPYPFATWLVGNDVNGGSFLGLMDEGDFTNLDPAKLVFSPNDDGYYDDLVPLAGVLRNAGTVSVDILDAEGNVVRTINTVENVQKVLGSRLAQGSAQTYTLLSADVSGDGTWDGTLYNSATGEYEAAPEGRYSVRLTATLAGSDVEETTEIPFTLDVTAPEVKILDVKQVAGDDGALELEVTYRLKDASPLVSTVLFLINGNVVDSSNCTITPAEEADTYSARIPSWLAGVFYQEGKLNEIALVADDYGFNESMDLFYTNVEFKTPVVFANIDLNAETIIPADLSYTEVTNPDGTPGYENISLQLRGVVDDTVAKLTANGQEATISENRFLVNIPVTEQGYVPLSVAATNEAGETVYSLEKQMVIDLGAPKVTGWVTDANFSGDWDDEHILVSHDAMFPQDPVTGHGSWCFATDYGETEGESDKVPVIISVEDVMLDSVTVEWIEGEITSEEFNGLNMVYLMGMPPFMAPSYPSEKVKSQTFSVDGADGTDKIEDGKIKMSLPFFIERAAQWSGALSHDNLQQWIRVTATDKAGNASRTFIYLEGGETAQDTAKEYPGSDIRKGSGMIDMADTNFAELNPIWDGSGPMPEYVVVTEEQTENGVLHLSGTLNKDVTEVWYNGERCEVTEGADGVLSSGFDMKLQPGLNILYYTTCSNILEMTWRVMVYYLPEGYQTVMTFGDERIKNDAVIYTSNDTFSVDGKIVSTIGGLNLSVNGDMILAYTASGVDVTGNGRITNFGYTVPLGEGENHVSVLLTDAAEVETKVDFIVIKDVKAPNAPTITSDESGKVTVTSDEEDVTLYYSLDGESWMEYAEAFTPAESGRIYAKAVDQAGNESDVVTFDVTLPAPPDDSSSDSSSENSSSDSSSENSGSDSGSENSSSDSGSENSGSGSGSENSATTGPSTSTDSGASEGSSPTSPGTGDSGIIAYFVVMVLAAVVLVCAAFGRRRTTR